MGINNEENKEIFGSKISKSEERKKFNWKRCMWISLGILAVLVILAIVLLIVRFVGNKL